MRGRNGDRLDAILQRLADRFIDALFRIDGFDRDGRRVR